MLESILRPWRSKDELRRDLETGDNLTQIPTSQRKHGLKLKLNTSNISRPIQRSPQSLTGFDGYDNPLHSSSSSSPPSIAWLRPRDFDNEDRVRRFPVVVPSAPPAAVVRDPDARHTHPMSRSVSSPVTSANAASTSRLGMNPAHAGSSYSLRLDPKPYVSNLYGNAYSYPGVKPLSPIAEQDYFSPESLRRTVPLPGVSDRRVSSTDSSRPSPAGSYSSEVARPSPVHSIPFLTRPVNRSLSQSTHRSGLSTTSLTAPSIPPLDLRPPFPGPHPSQDGDGPPMRPRKSTTLTTMPTIPAGSSEEYRSDDESSYDGGEGEEASLHAESFVTATSNPNPIPVTGLSTHPTEDQRFPVEFYATHEPIPVEFVPTEASMIRSEHSSRSPQSTSESFIRRRWEKDAIYPAGKMTLKAKRQWMCSTPAFWAFWLGFICPVLWLVGGWHFTNFGEQPPRLTFWEFYFNAGYWKEIFCCTAKRGILLEQAEESVKGKGKANTAPALPRWVRAKQSSESKMARLNDPRRSLKGISFGYPFVPRPLVPSTNPSIGPIRRALSRITRTLALPHRFFDQVYGVRLTNMRGKCEGRRRIFDPWIQRCRYAFCYAMLILCAALGTTATCLIIFNTRNLR